MMTVSRSQQPARRQRRHARALCRQPTPRATLPWRAGTLGWPAGERVCWAWCLRICPTPTTLRFSRAQSWKPMAGEPPILHLTVRATRDCPGYDAARWLGGWPAPGAPAPPITTLPPSQSSAFLVSWWITACSIHRYRLGKSANCAGGAVGTQHLLDLGHRHIGFITGDMTYGCAVERLEWLSRSSLAERGSRRRRGVCAARGLDPGLGPAGSGGAAPARPAANGHLASNDLEALGVYEAAHDAGLRAGGVVCCRVR